MPARYGTLSVAHCIKPGCKGGSQIENTMKTDTWYVKRTRACVLCGTTWSTAEIMLADVKRLKALDRMLKELK